MHPCSGPIGTPYGAHGSHWSGGIHKGVDFPVQTGTAVYAPWSGRVLDVSWGSAFGTHVVIDFDHLPGGAPGLYGVLAHLSTKLVRPGVRVAAGELVGRSGSTGNVTGPHLHFEVQRNARWASDGYVNPQPWLDARSGGGGGSSGGVVYLSKLKYGQRDSDSVRALQRALNHHLRSDLPVTGNYLDQTDARVRECQSQHGYGHDTPGHSFVGRRQATHLGLHIVD